jgi:hypothetical protein
MQVCTQAPTPDLLEIRKAILHWLLLACSPSGHDAHAQVVRWGPVASYWQRTLVVAMKPPWQKQILFSRLPCNDHSLVVLRESWCHRYRVPECPMMEVGLMLFIEAGFVPHVAQLSPRPLQVKVRLLGGSVRHNAEDERTTGLGSNCSSRQVPLSLGDSQSISFPGLG